MKDLFVKVSSDKEYQLLMQHYNEKGWTSISGGSDFGTFFDYKKEPCIRYRDNFTHSDVDYVVRQQYDLVDFKVLAFLKSIKTEIEFKLNDSYTATINCIDNTVTVGCQTFPFSIVKELASKLD